jgi:hypothetical protein
VISLLPGDEWVVLEAYCCLEKQNMNAMSAHRCCCWDRFCFFRFFLSFFPIQLVRPCCFPQTKYPTTIQNNSSIPSITSHLRPRLLDLGDTLVRLRTDPRAKPARREVQLLHVALDQPPPPGLPLQPERQE